MRVIYFLILAASFLSSSDAAACDKNGVYEGNKPTKDAWHECTKVRVKTANDLDTYCMTKYGRKNTNTGEDKNCKTCTLLKCGIPQVRYTDGNNRVWTVGIPQQQTGVACDQDNSRGQRATDICFILDAITDQRTAPRSCASFNNRAEIGLNGKWFYYSDDGGQFGVRYCMCHTTLPNTMMGGKINNPRGGQCTFTTNGAAHMELQDVMNFDDYNYEAALYEYRLAKEYLRRMKRRRNRDKVIANAMARGYADEMYGGYYYDDEYYYDYY